MNYIKKPLVSLDDLLGRIEFFLIVFFFLIILFMSFIQVILRNISSELAISWFDQVERQFTLWVGLFGAAFATRKIKHISIDVFSRFLGKQKIIIHSILNIFGALFCVILIHASYKYMNLEHELATEPLFTIDFLDLNIYLWYFTVVIPIGYSLIAMHFIINLLLGRTEIKTEDS